MKYQVFKTHEIRSNAKGWSIEFIIPEHVPGVTTDDLTMSGFATKKAAKQYAKQHIENWKNGTWMK